MANASACVSLSVRMYVCMNIMELDLSSCAHVNVTVSVYESFLGLLKMSVCMCACMYACQNQADMLNTYCIHSFPCTRTKYIQKYVCIHVCMHIYIYIYIYILYIEIFKRRIFKYWRHIHVYACMHVYMYRHRPMLMHTLVYTCIHTYSIDIERRTQTSTYIYTLTHAHT
jgi:hypothetical protein